MLGATLSKMYEYDSSGSQGVAAGSFTSFGFVKVTQRVPSVAKVAFGICVPRRRTAFPSCIGSKAMHTESRIGAFCLPTTSSVIHAIWSFRFHWHASDHERRNESLAKLSKDAS